MNVLSRLFLVLFVAICFSACADDDEPLASYVKDFAEIITDSRGRAVRVVLDGSGSRPVTNPAAFSGLVADSLYRAVVLYVPVSGGIELRGASGVISPRPGKFTDRPVRTDPVILKAAWRGGRYLNLLLALRSAGGSHAYGFVEEGIRDLADGKRMLRLTLYHDRNGDSAHYLRDVYLSCPLYGYAEELRAGTDSVSIRVFTSDGVRERHFLY